MKMLKDPKALSRLGLEAGVGFIPFGGVGQGLKMATADTVSPGAGGRCPEAARDPDPKSVSALADVTKDEKWLVRAAAVGPSRAAKNPSAIQVITPLLNDENDVVRFNAAAAVYSTRAIRRGQTVAKEEVGPEDLYVMKSGLTKFMAAPKRKTTGMSDTYRDSVKCRSIEHNQGHGFSKGRPYCKGTR